MSRRLYMVRHGPTHETAFTGWRDVPADLSDTGALARLSSFLPDAPMVSSDLNRAVKTADAIQGTRPRLPHHPDLREFNFGQWDGRHSSDVSETDPEVSRAFWEAPGDVAPPGGESWNDVTNRVGAAIARYWHDHQTLTVVAHFGVVLCHMAKVTGLPPVDALAHKIAPLSVTVLVETQAGWVAERINHQP